MNSNNLIFQNLIDFEYNKFKLLSFLQNVQESYNQNKLFPAYKDLKSQYTELVNLRENMEQMIDLFPKDLIAADIRTKSLIYDKAPFVEDKSFHDINLTISFAIPKLRDYLQTGKNMHDGVKEKLHLELIGLEPFYKKEGYLFLHQQPKHETHVFQYSLCVINEFEEDYVNFRTDYVKSYQQSISFSFENMKLDLMKMYKSELPLPAAYLVESKVIMPLHETFLPIARELLAEYVYNVA